MIYHAVSITNKAHTVFSNK